MTPFITTHEPPSILYKSESKQSIPHGPGALESLRIQGFRVRGLGFRVRGLGFGVRGPL